MLRSIYVSLTHTHFWDVPKPLNQMTESQKAEWTKGKINMTGFPHKILYLIAHLPE